VGGPDEEGDGSDGEDEKELHERMLLLVSARIRDPSIPPLRETRAGWSSSPSLGIAA
jgi:hypothetical protein